MIYHTSILVVAALIMLSGCATKRSEWDNIDYSRVYQRARENDANYTPPAPTVVGCVDDDLYNCNPKKK